ncbi:response regulator transcription factor [Virgibacillus sp. C22-A2]|uniref:Response regulator transcription factor n=1 Tax=Virgibacillus tibetensis TaxID=3042313 RepID=A0ABU6KHH2_9BACI|nr:response regulator transcription factor [Virgibacillus sp. C22-A2]
MMKIAIIDKDQLINRGLRIILDENDDFEILEIEPNSNTIHNKVDEFIPDIMLIHVNDYTNNFAEIINDLRKIYASIKIILMFPNGYRNAGSFDIYEGVNGFLLNNISAEGFVYSIRNVYDNQFVLSKEIAEKMISKAQYGSTDEKEKMKQKLRLKGISISSRDSDVLYLIYSNYKNKEIAGELQLPEKTVRDYVSRVYKKININNRKQVIGFIRQIMEE